MLDHDTMTPNRLRSTVRAFRRLLFLLAALPCVSATADPARVRSQLLYLPVYSELGYGDRRHTLNLSAIVTIRNTDQKRTINVTRVDYYDTAGHRVRAYQTAPRSLAPLASADYQISGADRSGGTSASFLIAWESGEAASPPLVGAVMIGAATTTGISFATNAQILEEQP